jgi:FAD:protein FMN transferase
VCWRSMRPASASARRARPLLGTFVEIDAECPVGADLEGAIESAFQAVAVVHGLMSFHAADSDVSRLNREASVRPVRVHAWTYEVLAAARELRRASAGVFDIGVAPALQDLGLLPRDGADARARWQPAPGADPVVLLPDRCVRFARPGVRIDLGGIAKGFAIDRAIRRLEDRGAVRGLINAGGDLAAFGPEASPVHVRDPRRPRHVLCRLEVSNEALATSGGAFDPFLSSTAAAPAVIDPRTRRPARGIAGATVRAPTCMVADALTKVVMVAGESAAGLLARHGASALFVSPDGELRIGADWQGLVRVAS